MRVSDTNVKNSTVDIDLWLWPLGLNKACVAELQEILSVDERARARRIKVKAAQRDFIAARARMRQCLACYGVGDATELQFDEGPHGKPALKNSDLQFNLSHTAGRAVLAVTGACAVGVDIEVQRPVDLRLVERFFSASEVMALTALSLPARTAAFFRIWTAKEAAGKALGLGLGLDFRSFSIQHGADQHILNLPSVSSPEREAANGTTLTIKRFSVPTAPVLPEVWGCVAVATAQPIRLHFRNINQVDGGVPRHHAKAGFR